MNFVSYMLISLLFRFSNICKKNLRINTLVSLFVLNYYKTLNLVLVRATLQPVNCLLVDKVTAAVEKKISILGIFLGLVKAVDTIDHEIHLRKLPHYGTLSFELVQDLHEWMQVVTPTNMLHRNRSTFRQRDSFEKNLSLPHKLTDTGNPPTQSLSVRRSK